MSKISKNIKKLRTQCGMTQEELAGRIHVTRQTVSSWETDRTQPDIEILQLLADAFGVEIEQLIYGKRKNPAEEKEKLLFSNTLVTVLSVLGCLLIGAGVVMLFVRIWRELPDAVKLITCFIPAFSGQGVGIYTYIKKRESIPWCEGACVLWFLGTAVTTSVLLGTADLDYNVVSDCWMFLFYTVTALVLMLFFRTLSPLAAVYGCSITWLVTALDDARIYDIDSYDDIGDLTTFIPVALVQAAVVGLAFYSCKRFHKKDSNIIRHTFASWINFVGLAASAFAITVRTVIWEGCISFIILAAILCFIIGQRHNDFISPYRALGLPASAVATCFVGMIFTYKPDIPQWINLLVIVLGLIPFALLCYEKTRPENLYLRLYAVLLTGSFFVYNCFVFYENKISYNEPDGIVSFTNGVFYTACFLLSLAAFIMLIVYGAKERKLLHLNLGFVLSCIMVIYRFYLLDLGLVGTGILLIVCGAGLLFVNLKISHLREREKLNSEAQGEEDAQ